jgi:glycosyltransferase involved in cell wall biosynthesis
VRILHVIQELGPGGAEHVVRRLCAASLASGDAVAVACAGAVLPPPGAVRLSLPTLARRPERALLAAFRLRRFAKNWRPDVIHAHNPGMAVVTALATRRGSSWPAMVTLHGVRPADDLATARLLRWTGLPVVACGEGVAEALREHHVEPWATISNGVAPPPPAADAASLRVEWSLEPELHLVVAAGRLVAQKRHDVAVAAAARVPDTAWVIVGEGPQRPALERQIEALRLTSRVRLVGARSDVRAVLGAADVVVQPSDWEGLPLVVLEAMRAARPVVASGSRGLRELLQDGVDGLLVPPGDAEALATCVARIITDQDLARRLGGAAAARAEREFSEAAMVSAYQSRWRTLSARPQHR